MSVVKLGRKWVGGFGEYPTFVHHWAVQVHGCWYEIGTDGRGKGQKKNKIERRHGDQAKSGAGRFGGEVVGRTNKTDDEIKCFNDDWLADNPKYSFTAANCQKYALDFIRWLTDNKYRLRHEPEAGDIRADDVKKTIAVNTEEEAFAAAHVFKGQVAKGPVSLQSEALSADAEVVCGPGVGAWANATLLESKVKAGPVGVKGGLNVKTGAGVHGGNLDVHILGFGVKAGADGLAINTPIAGAECSIM